jgi:predicted acyl esterase
VAFITATVRAYVNQPKRFEMVTIKRAHGAVFQTGKLKYSMRIRGVPTLKLNIVPKTSTNGTVIVYLLDVDNLTGEGKLITFSPWTFKNAVPGATLTLDLQISMTSYNLPAGNRLGVVISTKDPLFLDQSPDKSDITFVGGSVLNVPLHA